MEYVLINVCQNKSMFSVNLFFSLVKVSEKNEYKEKNSKGFYQIKMYHKFSREKDKCTYLSWRTDFILNFDFNFKLKGTKTVLFIGLFFKLKE